jgi:hypothetical protein
MPAAVGNEPPESQVADEVRQENEAEPPAPPFPVPFLLAKLDRGQVEGEGEREKEDERRRTGEEKEQHALNLIRRHGTRREPVFLRPGVRRVRDRV